LLICADHARPENPANSSSRHSKGHKSERGWSVIDNQLQMATMMNGNEYEFGYP
jgi:hypothetical protein